MKIICSNKLGQKLKKPVQLLLALVMSLIVFNPVYAEEAATSERTSEPVVTTAKGINPEEVSSQNNAKSSEKGDQEKENEKTSKDTAVTDLKDQPETPAPSPFLESQKEGPSLMQEGVKTIGMLTVLLVVFWWFSNWLKKSGRLARIAGTGGDIQCVSVFSVGQKEKIALIKVKDQELLIGITPTNIQALHHFTNANTRDKDAPSGSEFSKILDTAEAKTST